MGADGMIEEAELKRTKRGVTELLGSSHRRECRWSSDVGVGRFEVPGCLYPATASLGGWLSRAMFRIWRRSGRAAARYRSPPGDSGTARTLACGSRPGGRGG